MECLEDKRLAELIEDECLNNEVAPLDDFYDAHNVCALSGCVVVLEDEAHDVAPVWVFVQRCYLICLWL